MHATDDVYYTTCTPMPQPPCILRTLMPLLCRTYRAKSGSVRIYKLSLRTTLFSHTHPSTMTADNSGKGLLMKSDSIANIFRDEVKLALTKRTRKPKLVGVLSTSAAPSKFYADFTRKQCDELGVEFSLKTTGAAVSKDLAEGEGVEEAIIEANEDESVDGIMVSHTNLPSFNTLTGSNRSITPSLALSRFVRHVGCCLPILNCKRRTTIYSR